MVCFFLLLGISGTSQSHRIVRNEVYHGHFTEATFHFQKRARNDWKTAYYGLWGASLQAGFRGSEVAKKRYELFLDKFEIHLDTIRTSKEALHFLKTEFYLQKSLISLRYGDELDALFAFRQAASLSNEGIKKYPYFIPLKKSAGE